MNAAALKYWLLGLVIAGLAGATGFWLGRDNGAQAEPPTAAADTRQVLYWYDPMMPTQHFQAPGKSPFMDMQLVPKYAGDEAAPSSLSVPAQVVQNLGMRTATVLREVLPTTLDAQGSLAYNQRDVAILQARAAGFVERVYARAPGDVLPAGTPLADLLIPEWAAAQLEFIAVLHSADERLIEAARQRLRLLGIPESVLAQVQRTRQPRAIQTLVTPIAGELQALSLRAGMAVAAGQDLARINGLNSVWLDTAIPESQAAAVQPGAPISVTLTAFPGQTWQGRVIALLPSADLQTRTLTVRSELANPQGQLRPGMFAAVRLSTQDAQAVLQIPSEALLRTGKRTLVMLAEGEGRYRPHEIQVGREAEGRVEVLAGLQQGQAVVTSGQFLLDSEASLQGLLAQADAAAPPPPVALHEAQGVIRRLDEQAVLLEHGPFPSLDMPGMTMRFALAGPEVVGSLQVGDRVRIGVRQGATGLVVERLSKVEEAQ